MATGTYVVEVDWDNNGTFSGSAEVVTSRALHVEFGRGRDVDSQLTGRSIAGTCQIILNNQSGDYNSFNSASPLTGSLLPGRLVQVRATGPTAGTLWRGYIDRIIPKPSVKGLDTAVIEAIGPLGFVNLKRVSLPMLVDTNAGTIIGSILDQAGWPTGTAYRDIDSATGTAPRRVWFNHVLALDALRQIEETEGGFLRESGNGRIVFENRHRRMTSPYTASQATFTDSPTGTLVYMSVEQEDPLPFIFSEFIATVQPYTTGALSTLWRLQDTGTLSPLIPALGGAITLMAQYPNPSSTVNAIGVASWTTPTATVDYNLFTDDAGTGTNLNAAVALTLESFGEHLHFRFNNTGTADAYLTFIQARGVPLFADAPIQIMATGTGTAFGTRTYPNPSRFIPNINEANRWGLWNLGIYQNPMVRYSMTYIANKDNAHLTQGILREISDRVTFISTGTRGNLGVTRQMIIESMKHVIDGDRTHTVTYYLADSAGFSGGWVMGSSNLTTNTKLVY